MLDVLQQWTEMYEFKKKLARMKLFFISIFRNRISSNIL